MGSWNETCMLTNLPISHGEPVYAIFLAESSLRNHGVYPTDQYLPFAMVEGVYDDYGGLENPDSKQEQMILKAIAEVRTKDETFLDGKRFENINDLIYQLRDVILPENINYRMEYKPIVFLYTVFVKKPILDEMFKGLTVTDYRIGTEAQPMDNWAAHWTEQLVDLITKSFPDKMSDDPQTKTMAEMKRKTEQMDAFRDIRKTIHCDRFPVRDVSSLMEQMTEVDLKTAMDMMSLMMKTTYLLERCRMAYYVPNKGSDVFDVPDERKKLERLTEREIQRIGQQSEM